MNKATNLILYAEDDEDDIEFFRDSLEKLESENKLIVVSNGKKVLQALRERVPDIIFLDINMPVMDGMQCLKHIRTKMGELSNIPVVILSTSDFYKNEALKDGADYYFVKPVLQEEWIEIFNFCFDLHKSTSH
jgi:CheY-like chemotaxis protein